MARWADTEAAATYLGVSVRKIRRWRHEGKIRGHNPSGGCVLYDLDDLDAWVTASADPRPGARSAGEWAEAAKRQARANRRRLADQRARSAAPARGGDRGNSEAAS